MPSALSIIRVLKWICTLGLLLTVAVGAAVIDRRVTMLLLPPFFMYWGQTDSFAPRSLLKVPSVSRQGSPSMPPGTGTLTCCAESNRAQRATPGVAGVASCATTRLAHHPPVDSLQPYVSEAATVCNRGLPPCVWKVTGGCVRSASHNGTARAAHEAAAHGVAACGTQSRNPAAHAHMHFAGRDPAHPFAQAALHETQPPRCVETPPPCGRSGRQTAGLGFMA